MNFFNNHKRLVLIIGAGIFLITVGFIVLNLNSGRKNVPVLTTDIWRSFQPGKTGRDEVVKNLGIPIDEKRVDNNLISDFSSSSPTRNHEVIFNDQKIGQFFKEIVTAKDSKKASDLVQIYGQPQSILFGEDAVNGIYLYVYPTKGVAFLANKNSDTLFEIWHFEPTTLDNLIKNWAPTYSKNLNSLGE